MAKDNITIPLHQFLVDKFGYNWDLVDGWRSKRGGRQISQKEHAAAIKEWQLKLNVSHA